jgi:AraC-like DNA-binding protein
MRTPAEWDASNPGGLPEHLVYYFAQGSARAVVAGEAFACPRGSCCWITPGTPLRFVSNRSPLVWRFRFLVTAHPRETSLAPGRRFYFLPAAPSVATVINALLLELAHADGWQTASLRAWLIHFSIIFFRSAETSRRLTLSLAQRQAIADVVEQARPGAPLTPRDLARAAGLSLDYFSRVFRRTHGTAPRHWLVQQRLAHAAVLLQETPLRIGTIADRLGYENPELFSRQFTAHFGRSPRAFRS